MASGVVGRIGRSGAAGVWLIHVSEKDRLMMKKVVKLSEYRKKKKRDAHQGTGSPLSTVWVVAGVFAAAVLMVFVYLVLTGGTP